MVSAWSRETDGNSEGCQHQVCGGNTGNFDDAQTAVKKMFNDHELAAELDQAGFRFSRKPINIGRLVLRSYIMYMPTHHWVNMTAGSKTDRRSTRGSSTGNFWKYLLHIMWNRWDFQSTSWFCASNETVFFLWFLPPVKPWWKRLSLRHLLPWIFRSLSNLERLIYRLPGENAENVQSLWNP